MSDQDPSKLESQDIPSQVFEEFINTLREDGFSKASIDELKKVLIVDQQISESTLKNALSQTDIEDD